MRFFPPESLTIAKSFASGDQSAHWAASRTSRGVPPAIGTRASVPVEVKPRWSLRESCSATSPERLTPRRDTPAGTGRARKSGLPRREEKSRLSLPLHAAQ